jgi:hypothetical protein
MGERVDVDDICSAPEIATRLGISRQRVHQLADSRSSGFPDAIRELPTGKLWLWSHIEPWATTAGLLDVDGNPIPRAQRAIIRANSRKIKPDAE